MGKKARYGVIGKVAVLMEMLNADPWKYYPLNVQFLSTEISAERGRCMDPPPHVNLVTAPLASLVLENAAASKSAASGSIQQGYDLDEEGDDDGMESELVMSELTTVTQQQQSESILCSDDGNDDDDTENEATTRTSSQMNNSKISIISTKKEAIATNNNNKRRKKKSLTSCLVCGIAASRTWIPCPTCSTRCHVGCLAKHYLSIDPGGRTLPRNGHCPSCMTKSSWVEALGRTENVGWAQHKKRRTCNNNIEGAGEDDGEGGNTTKGAGGGGSRGRRAGVGATPIKASQSESVVVGESTTKKKKATLKGSRLNGLSNPLPPLPLGESVATKRTVSQIEDLSSQQLQSSQQHRKAVPINFDTDEEVDVGAYEAPPWDDYGEVVVIDNEEEEEEMDSNGTHKEREEEEEEIVIEDTPSPPPLMQRLMMTSKNVVGTAAAAKEKKEEEEDVIVILDSDDELTN